MADRRIAQHRGLMSRIRRIDPFFGIVIVGCLIARIALASAGVGMDMSALGPKGADHYWQLLDLSLLRHDLISSVWSLTMQPPLYNLSVGILLHLPAGWQAPAAASVLFALFAGAALATYATMVLLGVHRIVGLVATMLLVVADPGQVLFTTRPFYAAPTAALVTITAWLAVRCLKRPSTASAAWFASAAATTALFNTSVQPLLVLVLFGIIVLALPATRRAVAVGVAVPAVILVGWSALQIVRVGTPATSTWLGMNLAHVTLKQAPTGQVDEMVAKGELSDIATIPPFSKLTRYGVAPDRSGPTASRSAVRPDGQPNLNNRAYAGVSSRYFSDDLSYISHQPGHYLAMVSRGLRIWAVPEDQYYFFFSDHGIESWETTYDNWVMFQPTRNPYLPLAALAGQATPVDQISGTLVAATVLATIGAPVLAVIGWRRRRRWSLALLIPWLVFMEAFVVTSLSENGENNRFRFETGTVMLTLSVVVVCVIVDRLLRFNDRGQMSERLEALGWDDPASPAIDLEGLEQRRGDDHTEAVIGLLPE
jgi:hypothetical protein